MRLIGIQALLGLLQQRISAKAEAHGTASGFFNTVGVSNAGVIGSAGAVGSAAATGITSGRISGVGAAAGSGVPVNGVGVAAGLIASLGNAVSHGISAAVGEIKGLTAGIAQASGHSTASASSSSFGIASGIGIGAAQGIIIGTNATAGSASGAGSSNFIGDSGTVASAGSAAGIGDSSATSMMIRGATAASSGAGAASSTSTVVKAGDGTGTGIGAATGASPGPASDFLARTSGLNPAHTIAYMDLINGLVTDGVWSKLDVLYIFATADSTTALLNLVSTSFTGIIHGPPAFTADRGFTGVDGSSTVYIDSQFNPATAPSPQFVTNSCHASAWCDTSVTAGGGNAGAFLGNSGASGNQTSLYGRYNDGKAYFRINDGVNSAGLTSASSVGHWIASRTGSSTSVGYKNGTSFATPNQASGTIQSRNIYILAFNNNGSVIGGTGGQLTMVSFGAGLTATDASNFYSRLRTYMTSVGVP